MEQRAFSGPIITAAQFESRRRAKILDANETEACAKRQEALLASLIGREGVFANLSHKVTNIDPVKGLLDSLVGTAQVVGTNEAMDYDIDPDEDNECIIAGNYMTIPALWAGKNPLTIDIVKITNETGGDILGIFVMHDMQQAKPLLAARFFERPSEQALYKEKLNQNMENSSCVEDCLWRFLSDFPDYFDKVRIVSIAFTKPEGGGPDEGEPVYIQQAA